MVTIKFSNKQELVLPQWLGETLGLREGDRVEVQQHEDVLQLRPEPYVSPGPLTDIAHIITSSHPVGSVDIAPYMDKHGYEQLDR